MLFIDLHTYNFGHRIKLQVFNCYEMCSTPIRAFKEWWGGISTVTRCEQRFLAERASGDQRLL